MHMKKFMAEFKQFALRGNVLDMAVGVIIGGAFTGIITALTENFINPILDFLIRGTRYTAQDIAGFGSNFLGAVINFIIMAFILFCLIKGINKLMTIGQKKKLLQLRRRKSVHSARAKFLSKLPAVHTVLPNFLRNKIYQ